MIKRTIHKFHIPTNHKIGEPFVVQLPHMGYVLDFAFQNSELYCWVDYMWIDGQEKLMVDNKFIIYGTGYDIPDDDNLLYLKTVHYNGFVWHIYRIEQ